MLGVDLFISSAGSSSCSHGCDTTRPGSSRLRVRLLAPRRPHPAGLLRAPAGALPRLVYCCRPRVLAIQRGVRAREPVGARLPRRYLSYVTGPSLSINGSLWTLARGAVYVVLRCWRRLRARHGARRSSRSQSRVRGSAPHGRSRGVDAGDRAFGALRAERADLLDPVSRVPRALRHGDARGIGLDAVAGREALATRRARVARRRGAASRCSGCHSPAAGSGRAHVDRRARRPHDRVHRIRPRAARQPLLANAPLAGRTRATPRTSGTCRCCSC